MERVRISNKLKGRPKRPETKKVQNENDNNKLACTLTEDDIDNIVEKCEDSKCDVRDKVTQTKTRTKEENKFVKPVSHCSLSSEDKSESTAAVPSDCQPMTTRRTGRSDPDIKTEQEIENIQIINSDDNTCDHVNITEEVMMTRHDAEQENTGGGNNCTMCNVITDHVNTVEDIEEEIMEREKNLFKTVKIRAIRLLKSLKQQAVKVFKPVKKKYFAFTRVKMKPTDDTENPALDNKVGGVSKVLNVNQSKPLLHSKFKFKPNSKLYKYICEKTDDEQKIYLLSELLTVLKNVTRREAQFDERNPSIIICSPDLEEALNMKTLHVTEIRDLVLSHLIKVPDDELTEHSSTCLQMNTMTGQFSAKPNRLLKVRIHSRNTSDRQSSDVGES